MAFSKNNRSNFQLDCMFDVAACLMLMWPQLQASLASAVAARHVHLIAAPAVAAAAAAAATTAARTASTA